jgi:hypothetical protein
MRLAAGGALAAVKSRAMGPVKKSKIFPVYTFQETDSIFK